MYFLLVVLHLLGTVVWLGGLLFIGLVVVPVSRAFGETGQNLVRSVGRRFLWIAWPAIAVTLGTGVVLGFLRGFLGALLTGSLGDYPQIGLFLLKVVLVGVVLVLEVFHDWLIPALATRRERAAYASNPPDRALLAQAQALRRATAWVASVNGGVALVVVFLGVWLSRI